MRGPATWVLLATLTSWSNRTLADDPLHQAAAAEARLLLEGKKPLTAGVLLAPSVSNGSASGEERELFASSLGAMGLRIVAIEFFPPEAVEARARESAIVDLAPALMLAGWSRCSTSGRKSADLMLAAVFRHFVVEREVIAMQTRTDWVMAVAPLALSALGDAQGRWFEATAAERAKRVRACETGR